MNVFGPMMAGTGALRAQDANPMSAAIRQMYTGVKNNLENMAEKMPEENYSFKPTPRSVASPRWWRT